MLNTIPFDSQAWLRNPELKACGHYLKGILIDIMCMACKGNPYGTLTDQNGRRLHDDDVSQRLGLELSKWKDALIELTAKHRLATDPLTDAICVPRMLRDGKPNRDPIIDRLYEFVSVSGIMAVKGGSSPDKGQEPAIRGENREEVAPQTAKGEGGAAVIPPPGGDATKGKQGPKKRQRRDGGEPEFAVPDPFPEDIQSAWVVWLKFRRIVRRNPVSNVAMALQKQLLKSCSESDACEII